MAPPYYAKPACMVEEDIVRLAPMLTKKNAPYIKVAAKAVAELDITSFFKVVLSISTIEKLINIF